MLSDKVIILGDLNAIFLNLPNTHMHVVNELLVIYSVKNTNREAKRITQYKYNRLDPILVSDDLHINVLDFGIIDEEHTTSDHKDTYTHLKSNVIQNRSYERKYDYTKA